MVPRPATRGRLVKDVHERAEHLGVNKTPSLPSLLVGGNGRRRGAGTEELQGI
jgi:hypothetical protein